MSGNKCAFPECNNELVTNNGRLIGEICSIIPLRPYGPRASSEITEHEYNSLENFIFLCPYHHRLIDIDPETYTVKYLKELKVNHEKQFTSTNEAEKEKIEIPDGLSIKEIIQFWEENKENDDEEFWQKMFSNHPQIISCFYPNPLIKIGEKTYFGGKGIDNKGGNIGDFLYKNKITGAVAIVEIKTPKTKLLAQKYRQNSYSISKEFSGSIVQTYNYKMEVQRDFHRLKYGSSVDFEIIEPACMIIIGSTNEIKTDKIKHKSFELFRNSLNNTLVVTYDELFEKLQTIEDLTNNNYH